LSPEIKILLYIVFVLFLFLSDNLTAFLILLAIFLPFFILIRNKKIRSGAIPITLFLIVTFMGNLFFQKGKIILTFHGIDITEEGIIVASTRTIRVFLMILGAKFLTLTTEVEDLAKALGSFLKPLQMIRIPVRDFIEIMVLSLRAFPLIKKMIQDKYREDMEKKKTDGLIGKAMVIASILMPLFVSTINSPEKIFKDMDDRKSFKNDRSLD